MKTYTHLIYKEFKVNRKRYIYTIIGIIIGIILFTSVCLVKNFLEKVGLEYAKTEKGNYEVKINNVNLSQIQDIKSNVKIKDCGIIALKEKEKLKGENIEKILDVYAFDNIALNNIFQSSITLNEGRYPKNQEEIIIDSRSQNQIHKKIGDSIKVEDSVYKIVGIYRAKEEAWQNIIAITTFKESNNYKNIYALINLKSNKNIIKNSIAIANDVGINIKEENGELEFNNLLLYYYDNIYDVYGDLNQRVIGFMSMTLGILILTVILINSSINTSIKERIKCFGILRCIGASESKIKLLLLKESLILVLASIIPGIILGYLVGLFVVDVVLLRIVKMSFYGVAFNMDINIVFYAVILTFATVLISSFLPIVNASKTSPIYAIKSNGISENKVNRIKSGFVRKVFGYKTELAYKNLLGDSRNFKRSLLMLSTILITFTIFTGLYVSQIDSIKDESSIINKDFNISISTPPNRDENSNSINIIDNDYIRLDETKNFIEKTEAVDNLSSYMTLNLFPVFKGVDVLTPFSNEKEIFYNGEKYTYIPNSNFIIYDDNAFEEIEKYINGNDVSLKNFKDEGAILINKTSKGEFFARRKEKIFNVKDGENISVYIDRLNNRLIGDKENIIERIINLAKPINIKVIGTINRENILNKNSVGSGLGANIIVSRSFYENNKERLLGEDSILSSTSNIGFNFINNNKRNESIESIKLYVDKIGGWFVDNHEEALSQKRNLAGLSIIIYILLFLIGSIGVMNMINNKNINILLRKKEFGIMIAVGMKKSALRKIIILEGVIQWIIASLVGGILSYISLTLIYKLTLYFNEISKMTTPIWILILGILGIGVISVGSSIVASRKVNKMEGASLLENEE